MQQLVGYSDSDESDAPPSTDRVSQGTKRKRAVDDDKAELPPLPDSFHNLYASTARLGTRDDPDLHGGRQRQIPHVEGNWPTHVYVEWFPSTEQSSHLQKLLDKVGAKQGGQLQSLLRSDLGTELPLHISLSRPIVLQAQQRQPFLSLLTSRIRELAVVPFQIHTSDLDWVSNQEDTRWFLVLRVRQDQDNHLGRLLTTSNRTVVEHGQPPLYSSADPAKANISKVHNSVGSPNRGRASSNRFTSRRVPMHRAPAPDHKEAESFGFHISIGWSLTTPSKESLQEVKDSELSAEAFTIPVTKLKVKMGNGVIVLDLAERREARSGIISG